MGRSTLVVHLGRNDSGTGTLVGFVVGRAVGLGGATDYLGAMTGALCGAANGVGALPNTDVGRLEPLQLLDVAGRLAARQPK